MMRQEGGGSRLVILDRWGNFKLYISVIFVNILGTNITILAVQVEEDGRLKIIDRKKDLVKLQFGE